MPGGSKKGHTYLNKPAGESCRFVKVCVSFLLPPGIKGLTDLVNICLKEFSRLLVKSHI